MDEKEKLLKKTKLIFLIEYLVIALILITIGLLRIFDVIPYDSNRLLVYNIITLIAVAYIYFDTTWFIVSKKKRERSDLVDKIFPIPVALFLTVFDILVLAKIVINTDFFKYSISSVLLYVGLGCLFLGIYHHYKPSKMLLLAVEEEYAEKLKEIEEQNSKDETSGK